MAKEFQLEIVTPDREVFSEKVVSLVVPAHRGYLGILAGHAPLVCSLQPGEIKIGTDKGDRFYSTAGGFLEVGDNRAILLSESIEDADNIDLKRAEEALERAKKRMIDREPDLDEERARLALAKALNRLQIARKRGR